MPNEVFEQVVDGDGIPVQGISGGLQTVIDKLEEIKILLININDKLPESHSG